MRPDIFKKESIISQTFPEVCSYSCSKNNEIRNFILYKENYLFEFWKIKYRFLHSIRVECSNCHWTAKLPSTFAKKIFRHGLRANTLIRYSQDKLLSSRLLNLIGNLWKVWTISLAVLIILFFFRFYSQPVIFSEPKTVSVEELQSGKYIGEIVKVNGKVDYALALTKDDLVENQRNELQSITREVYLPIFSENDSSQFVVLRGGPEDVSNVLGRVGLTDGSLIKNQNYSTTGKIEKIDSITNNELKDFFTAELPKAKSAAPAKVIINNVGLINIYDFLLQFLNYFLTIVTLLVVSIYIQLYIDKKIVNK